jgi:hypothetical protein
MLIRIGIMATPFLNSLDAEISRLETVLNTIPEMKQLVELRRLRSLYNTVGNLRDRTEELVNTGLVLHRPGRRMSSERQQALEFAQAHMMGQTYPTKTVDLLNALRANGIEIGGNDPINSLSALLSTSSRFVAHGRSGWTLKPEAAGNRLVYPSMVPQPTGEVKEN